MKSRTVPNLICVVESIRALRYSHSIAIEFPLIRPAILLRGERFDSADYSEFNQESLRIIVPWDSTSPSRSDQPDSLHLNSRNLLNDIDLTNVPMVSASVHDSAEIRQAERQGVDCLILGSVYDSITSPEKKGMGLSQFGRLIETVSTPVIAIGGIDSRARAKEVLSAGAYGVAGISLAKRESHPLLEQICDELSSIGTESRKSRQNGRQESGLGFAEE